MGRCSPSLAGQKSRSSFGAGQQHLWRNAHATISHCLGTAGHRSRQRRCVGAGADLVAAAGEGALPVEMGRSRRARLRQPPEGRRRAQGHQPDQDRRGDRARPCAERQDAVLRHAPLRRAHQAHVPEQAQQQARLQRGDRDLRDRPGRHPARRLRPPEPRGQPLQLLQDQRDLHAQRLHQARHPPDRHVLHPRRADRRGRLQGRGDAGRHLRDHGGGSGGRPQEAGNAPCSPATRS